MSPVSPGCPQLPEIQNTKAQLELHRQNMEWCIGTIAKARHRHVDAEPEFDERPDVIWG